MDAQLLLQLEGVTVEHLVAGKTTLIGVGTVSLALLTTTTKPSTLGPRTPPPIPSRPVSPTPPPLPPRVDPKAAPSQSDALAPPPLPSRPSSPVPAPAPVYEATIDQWLILQLASATGTPVFEMPIPASTRILSSPPSSYVIPSVVPNWGALFGGGNEKADEGDGSGFVRITLPPTASVESREALEHYLWGLASFSGSAQDLRSRLVLVDEDRGTIIGELSADCKIDEDPHLALEGQGASHEKEPVIVDIGSGSETSLITVRAVSAWKATDNPTGSSIISLADWVSQGIVVGAEVVGRGLSYGAGKFVEETKPNEKPLVFSVRTKSYVGSGHKATSQAVKISTKTVEIVGQFAAQFGDTLGKKLGIQTSSSGKQPTGVRGVINRSLIAFNTLADGVTMGGKTLLEAGSASSEAVVGHRYGPEAQGLVKQVGGSVKHVALVYIDARGVTRKALLKSVGKHAIRARMADGREVVLDSNSLQGTPELPPRAK